jgi:putative transcriptional regulator
MASTRSELRPASRAQRWVRRLLATLAALALPATLFAAAPPKPAVQPPPPEHVSLAGQLLIASPAMGDPRFAQTVVLMVRHDRNGAFGIVINRPVGELALAAMLEALGESAAGASDRVRIFYGGPVQPELAFVLHSAEYRGAETVAIGQRLAMTANRQIFNDLAAGKGPQKSLIAFGYAGWSAGQLEGEIARDGWFTAPADAALVFDEARERVWERAMERRTRDL